MADHTIEIAALRNDIQTLRNNKQDRMSTSTGIPLDSEGSDGDSTFRFTADKGLLMFYKYAGSWYSSPFNVGTWNLEDSINELVQDITVSNVTIEESSFTSQNITGTLTIENAGTLQINASATVTGLSHSDLDDVGTGTGLGGNVHTQYAGAWSITNSQTLEFSTDQIAGDIATGAIETVLKNASLVADGDGLAVNESGYSFTLDNTLTLQPTSSTSLHISSAFADKIKLTDNSNDVVIGSSNGGDLNLTPINGAKVLIQGDNSSNNAGLGSSSYTSGWGGAGWVVSRPSSGFSSGEWMLEVDNMSVRGTLSVFELLIQQIRATNGSLFVSSAAKLFKVIDSSTLAFEDPSNSGLVPFATGDILLCQRVQVGQTADAYSDSTTNLVKRIIIEVTGTGSTTIGGTTYGTITYGSTSGAVANTGSIAEGDDFVRIGSTSDSARRSSILLTSDFANAPFIDFNAGVDSWATWKGDDKNKVRIGNLDGVVDSDIIGSLTGFGLYGQNVFLKGEIQANTGYIGTKNAGWTINSDGISTDVAGRKIFMGTGANNDTYGHQDCWFLAESYDPGDGDIEARISLGDCFKVDSDSHEIKLSESANNYVHIKAAEPQVAIYSNGARALTFESTGPKFTLGDPDATHPNYLQYSGTDLTLVSHGDQYFKVTSGATPTVTIGNPVGNGTNWMELTGGSFKLWNRNAAGTAEDFITMDSEGNANFKGSITITNTISSSDISDVSAFDGTSSSISDVSAFDGTSSSISDVGADADNTANNESFSNTSELQTSIWGSAANPPLDADNTGDNETYNSTNIESTVQANQITYSSSDFNLSGLAADAPSGSGLFMDASNLGYYADGGWKTYMGSGGGFYLGGPSGALVWDGSDLLIDGGGTFSGALSAATGTFEGAVEAGSIDADTTITGSYIKGAVMYAPNVQLYGSTSGNLTTYGSGPMIQSGGMIDNDDELPTTSTLAFSNVRYGSKVICMYSMANVDHSYTIVGLGLEKSYDAGATWSSFGNFTLDSSSGTANTSTTGWHNHSYVQGGFWMGQTDYGSVYPATTGANKFTVRFRINATTGSGEFTTHRLVVAIFSNTA